MEHPTWNMDDKETATEEEEEEEGGGGRSSGWQKRRTTRQSALGVEEEFWLRSPEPISRWWPSSLQLITASISWRLKQP